MFGFLFCFLFLFFWLLMFTWLLPSQFRFQFFFFLSTFKPSTSEKLSPCEKTLFDGILSFRWNHQRNYGLSGGFAMRKSEPNWIFKNSKMFFWFQILILDVSPSIQNVKWKYNTKIKYTHIHMHTNTQPGVHKQQIQTIKECKFGSLV